VHEEGGRGVQEDVLGGQRGREQRGAGELAAARHRPGGEHEQAEQHAVVLEVDVVDDD
jgi:hypothetical protein